MREIKFRARKKTVHNYGTTYESKHFDWVYYEAYQGLPPIKDKKTHCGTHEEWVFGQVEIQYTGLKDSKGDDIWEGDILGHISTKKAGYSENGKTILHIVKFGEANPDNSSLTDYVGYWAYHPNDLNSDCPSSIKYQIQSHKSEVIGNIYENPELLTDKEG